MEEEKGIEAEVKPIQQEEFTVALNPHTINRQTADQIKKELDRIVELKEANTTLSSEKYFEKLKYVPPVDDKVEPYKRQKREKIPKFLRELPKSTNKTEPGDRRKVAIVGFAETTRDKAPWNDPTFEIWGLNELYMVIPRADRWFEIHCDHNIRHSFRDPKHWEWLKTCEIPVYMTRKYKEIPTCIVYPKDKMLKMFGDVFSSSIAEMYAYAIYEGFDEIHMYGVDMALKKEYGAQKSAVEYLHGLATGMGIVTYIPIESDILKVGFMYGYDDPTPFAVKMKEKNIELQRKIQGAGAAEREAHDALQKLIGAKQLNDYYTENFVTMLYNAKYKDK